MPMKTSMSSVFIFVPPLAAWVRGQPVDDRSRTHVTKDLTHCGPFPLSAVTSARLLRVTTPPGSSKDRGKTSCPQQLAQPRTTRDHQQGNGELSVRTALMMRKTRLAHRPEGCRVYFTGLLP